MKNKRQLLTAFVKVYQKNMRDTYIYDSNQETSRMIGLLGSAASLCKAFNLVFADNSHTITPFHPPYTSCSVYVLARWYRRFYHVVSNNLSA